MLSTDRGLCEGQLRWATVLAREARRATCSPGARFTPTSVASCAGCRGAYAEALDGRAVVSRLWPVS